MGTEAILCGHLQRTNPMGTITKDQSYGDMYKGQILREHV